MEMRSLLVQISVPENDCTDEDVLEAIHRAVCLITSWNDHLVQVKLALPAAVT